MAVAARPEGISLNALDGTNRLLVPLPPDVTAVHNMSWSPDGAQLAYTVQTGSQHDIWVLTMGETPTAAPLLDSAASELSPKFSPDGRWLAYQSDEPGRSEIYIQRYPAGERLAVSAEGGWGPVWSPDGMHLYFMGPDRGVPKLMAVSVTPQGDRLELGKPIGLFELRLPDAAGVIEQYQSGGNTGGAGYDILPDGERFVMTRNAVSDIREIVVVQNWFEELKRLVPTE